MKINKKQVKIMKKNQKLVCIQSKELFYFLRFDKERKMAIVRKWNYETPYKMNINRFIRYFETVDKNWKKDKNRCLKFENVRGIIFELKLGGWSFLAPYEDYGIKQKMSRKKKVELVRIK